MKILDDISSCLLDTENILLKWNEVLWDAKLFGSPVLQVEAIDICGDFPDKDMNAFITHCIESGVELISARLPHESIVESIFLEKHGFRFIEMMYQPIHKKLHLIQGLNDHGLTVDMASEYDISNIQDIAESAFINERFYIDPRIPNSISNKRFKNWVTSSFDGVKQKLYVVKDQKTIIAFFIVEYMEGNKCYWHLNAVSPEFQGKGYGRRAWLAMIENAVQHGSVQIETSIAARNYKVLNLYASLNFFFQSPKMTFHWVREK